MKLTWDNVKEIVRKGSPRGLTNRQIAALIETDEQRVAMLTRLMFEAGELDRDPKTFVRGQAPLTYRIPMMAAA